MSDPLDVCNSTRELESFTFSCTNPSRIDVKELGYISETFANKNCEGTPFEIEQNVGEVCRKKEKHFCQGDTVKVFHFRTEDCSGDSYKSEDRFKVGSCVEVEEGSGIYRKVMHCGNDPLLPDWLVIGSIILASVLVGFVFLSFAIICVYCNVIKKGGYYNPIIEEEKGIVEGYSEL